MSVYLHRGDIRYHYTHEIPFAGETVPHGRRVSVICRTQPLTITLKPSDSNKIIIILPGI